MHAVSAGLCRCKISGLHCEDLVFAKDPMMLIEELKKDSVLKGVGEPELCLGGSVETLGDV